MILQGGRLPAYYHERFSRAIASFVV
jgi:hypothetical protein